MTTNLAEAETFSAAIKSHVPPHVPQDLVRDFDVYNSPILGDDPQAGYKRLQESNPRLFYTPRLGGHWVLLDPDLIEGVLHDSERFSSRTLQLPKPASFPRPLVPVELDPPEHGKYRKLLNGPFSPRVVAALQDGLRASAIEMIENVRGNGKCDFVADLARRFPVKAFLQLYGLPVEDGERLLRWMHMSYHDLTIEARMEAVKQTHAYFDAIVADRKANPRDDLVSSLVNADVDGKPIAPEMLASMLYLVLVAGLDTVTESLAFSMRFLAKNPGHRKQLLENPDIIPDAVEELLRRFGPIWQTRLAKGDFEFAGQQFKLDDQVFMPMLLIGMDERTVPNPLDVDFTRKGVKNAAFGLGPHRCVGSHLARMEMKIFLEEWIKRIPDFAIAPGTKPRVGIGVTVVFMENLDLVWPA